MFSQNFMKFLFSHEEKEDIKEIENINEKQNPADVFYAPRKPVVIPVYRDF